MRRSTRNLAHSKPMSQSELVIDICFHVTACCATISTANIFRRRQSNLVLSAVPDSAQTRLLSSCDGLSHFVTTVRESAKKRVLSAPVWASGATSRSYCPARCFHLRRGLRHQGTRWALRSSLHRFVVHVTGVSCIHVMLLLMLLIRVLSCATWPNVHLVTWRQIKR